MKARPKGFFARRKIRCCERAIISPVNYLYFWQGRDGDERNIFFVVLGIEGISKLVRYFHLFRFSGSSRRGKGRSGSDWNNFHVARSRQPLRVTNSDGGFLWLIYFGCYKVSSQTLIKMFVRVSLNRRASRPMMESMWFSGDHRTPTFEGSLRAGEVILLLLKARRTAQALLFQTLSLVVQDFPHA